jgi:hypothetical protein
MDGGLLILIAVFCVTMGLNLMGNSSSAALSPLMIGSNFLIKNGIHRPGHLVFLWLKSLSESKSIQGDQIDIICF